MSQWCQCGAQAGYLHEATCPRPLYRDDPQSVAAWQAEREQRVSAGKESMP